MLGVAARRSGCTSGRSESRWSGEAASGSSVGSSGVTLATTPMLLARSSGLNRSFGTDRGRWCWSERKWKPWWAGASVAVAAQPVNRLDGPSQTRTRVQEALRADFRRSREVCGA
jgi:hypothetical protein